MKLDGILELPTIGKIVRVVPECAFERCLDYVLPEAEWSSSVQLGHRLRVPWGKGDTFAYVVEFPEKPEVDSCRQVLSKVDEEPLIPPVLIRLAYWMARYYCCEVTQVLKGMLPEMLRSRTRGYKEQLWVNPEVENLEAVKFSASAKAQKRALQAAVDQGGGWLSILCRDTGTSQATWRSLEKKGWISLAPRAQERKPFRRSAHAQAVTWELTSEQKKAIEVMSEERVQEVPQPILLHGVTGSGKTEVYLRLIEDVLKNGKQALVLVPEISLTAQTIERFRARFETKGHEVAVLHSHLSKGERHDQWQRIRSGEASIVIGVRSGIFAPLDRLGVIIVDEEHEQSFKQEDTPRYHARDLAVLRGAWEKALVVLGSATPSLESMQNARSGKYRRVRLTTRTDDRKLPVIHVVDLRKEKSSGKGAFFLSQPLQDAIRLRLSRNEQSILFLNRRGYSTSLQCPKCGYVDECPSCSVSMTYHRADAEMRCHLCDHVEEVKEQCPDCGFREFKYGGMGTQRIEDVVAGLFPEARWQRMDSDSMRGKHAFEDAFEEFKKGELDLLIGTQMITKGLDFPNVTCVGIINVDGALQLPDFRAAERVFQQLVQVAGRAGRGDKPGEVFLQTFTPFHPTIQFARHHDVSGFLDHELEFRQAQTLPPFRRCAVVGIRSQFEDKAKFCAEQVAKRLQQLPVPDTEISGMAAAPIERMRNQYRFQVVCFTQNMPALSRMIGNALLAERWPDGVYVTIDIDAYHLL
ncbi:MAG: primosomal protein N' [Verrucomicrobiota bacterium]